MGEIGVHERDRVELRRALGQRRGDAGLQARGHAEVARVVQRLHERVALARLLQAQSRAVATAVVDGQRHQVQAGASPNCCQALRERRDVALLVVHREHDGDAHYSRM
jgi:hypothetical protein